MPSTLPATIKLGEAIPTETVDLVGFTQPASHQHEMIKQKDSTQL